MTKPLMQEIEEALELCEAAVCGYKKPTERNAVVIRSALSRLRAAKPEVGELGQLDTHINETDCFEEAPLTLWASSLRRAAKSYRDMWGG